MENQNNNETNSKIEVNEVKTSKKKKKVSAIVIVVLVVLLLFSCVGNIGGSESSAPATDSTTVKEDKESAEKEDEKQPEEELESEEESDEKKEPDVQLTDEEFSVHEKDPAHYYVGDTAYYENGTMVTIMDVGILASNHYGVPVLWMDVEINNQSEKTDTWYSQEFSIYIDDYQIETSPVSIEANDDFDPFETSVNPGRKARFKFTSKLPSDYDSASKIEIEFPGSTKTVLVKENGAYLYGQEAVSAEDYDYGDPGNTGAGGLDESMYGDHLNLDGLGYVLNFEPIGNGADALTTIKDGSDNYQWVLYMEDERTGYLYHMEEYVEVGTIYFSMDGIAVESSEHTEFNGLYW